MDWRTRARRPRRNTSRRTVCSAPSPWSTKRRVQSLLSYPLVSLRLAHQSDGKEPEVVVLTCLSPNRTLISIICFAAGVVADREFQSYTTLEYKKTAINWRR